MPRAELTKITMAGLDPAIHVPEMRGIVAVFKIGRQ
jgi:hypothetical protein